MEHIDNLILNSIKNEYKCASEIAKELNVERINHINDRLRSLLKYKLVLRLQSSQQRQGIAPFKYKAKL